jgi:hypothetical protein
MSVSATTSKVQYIGNNSAVTPYPVSFYYQDEAWLVVELVDEDGVTSTLTLGTDYAVTGAGNPLGGSITTTLAYDNTHTLTIYRVVPLTQLIDFVYNDRLPAAMVEAAIDKLTYIAQQLAESTAPGEIALSFPATEPSGNLTSLPSALARLGKLIYFNATTGEMELITPAELALTIDPSFEALVNSKADVSALTAGLALKQNLPQVQATSFTAALDSVNVTTATATVTDPTPAEGKGYTVFVRAGTTTIDAVPYTAGTIIKRIYQSASWVSYPYYTAAALATLTQTLTNKTLTSPTINTPTINDYIEGTVSIGNSGTSQTLSLSSGTFQTVTMTGNCTFTMPTPTAGKSFLLKVMTGSGGFTGTFTGVKWSFSSTPVITATAGRYDLFSFIADGTAWSGSAVQNFTP